MRYLINPERYLTSDLKIFEYLQGIAYPSVQSIWSFWAPPAEKTKLATIGFAGVSLTL